MDPKNAPQLKVQDLAPTQLRKWATISIQAHLATALELRKDQKWPQFNWNKFLDQMFTKRPPRLEKVPNTTLESGPANHNQPSSRMKYLGLVSINLITCRDSQAQRVTLSKVNIIWAHLSQSMRTDHMKKCKKVEVLKHRDLEHINPIQIQFMHPFPPGLQWKSAQVWHD